MARSGRWGVIGVAVGQSGVERALDADLVFRPWGPDVICGDPAEAIRRVRVSDGCSAHGTQLGAAGVAGF